MLNKFRDVIEVRYSPVIEVRYNPVSDSGLRLTFLIGVSWAALREERKTMPV